MFYYMPVKVFMEKECVRNHAGDIAAFGKKALIVTGRHSAALCGALDDVKEALRANEIPYVHFSEVEENPSVDTVMKARDLGIAEHVDFVIGIGGGSPMDAAKAIALMIRHKGADASYLYDKTSDSSALPVVEIPTTCGTGSEVTAVSILTRHDTMSKGSIPHKIFGDLALLDAEYLRSASLRTLSSTAIDAFAHLTESYISSDATAFSRSIALTGLKTWSGCRDLLSGAGQADDSVYKNMLLASTYGGMAIAHTGTSIPHALSYTLTVHLGMRHGAACGYFLPAYMKAADPADVDAVLAPAGFRSIEDFESFYQAVCQPEQVSPDILELAVKDVLTHPDKMAKAPFHTDESVLCRIAGLD